MRTRKELLEKLRRELPYIREKFHVKSIGVFGSYSREDQEKRSDIDILVEFERPVGLFKFIRLEDYLSERLERKVDLVTPDALKPLTKPSIMRDVVYA